jgi:hypothetical protein
MRSSLRIVEMDAGMLGVSILAAVKRFRFSLSERK